MKIIRTWSRLFAFVALLSLSWTQAVSAAHDQLHHDLSEDCVICKVVETSNDKVDVSDYSYDIKSISHAVSVFIESNFYRNNLRGSLLSRAPPASV